jgi:hypothetical protein
MNLPATLPDLAGRINAEHEACLASAQDAVSHAIEVGRLLVEAKDQVRHGEWSGWVEANCTFGIRQAQNYMRAHHNRGAIEGQMRSGDSHFVGLHGVVTALADSRADPPATEDLDGREGLIPAAETDPEARHRFCQRWWDQRARLTVMLAAAGWDVDRIADFLGRPPEDIEAILDPRLPVRFDTEMNGQWMFSEGTGQAQIQRMAEYYADNVTYRIEQWLEEACRRARWTCKWEGFGHVAPILEAQGRQHVRRWKAAKQRGIWPFLGFTGALRTDGAFWWCTILDARHAVRIAADGDAGDWAPDLMSMMAHQLECLKKLDNRIAR